jgi:hypothetical protein
VLFGGGVVVVAALIGAGAGLWAGRTLPTHTATPQTLRGTVTLVGANGDEFAIDLDGSHTGSSFALGPVPWKDADGWHDGAPVACIRPLAPGRHISFGVVHVSGGEPYGDVVVWVDCS